MPKVKTLFRPLFLSLALAAPLQSAHGERYRNFDIPKDRASHTLDIMGYADRVVKSDRAVLTITFSLSGKSVEEVRKKMQEKVQALKSLWISQGAKESSLHGGSPEVGRQNMPFGLWQRYFVDFRIQWIIEDVEKVPQMEEKTLAFLGEDPEFKDKYLEYQYSRAAELHQELAREALLNGQKVAHKYGDVIALGRIPLKVNFGSMSCYPCTNNPVPYETHVLPSALYNTFSVRVDMCYEILDSTEKKAQQRDLIPSIAPDSSEMGSRNPRIINAEAPLHPALSQRENSQEPSALKEPQELLPELRKTRPVKAQQSTLQEELTEELEGQGVKKEVPPFQENPQEMDHKESLGIDPTPK